MKVNFKNHKKIKDFNKCIIEKGLKFSKKRMQVIEHFLIAKRHYTVEQLYDEIKKINPGIGYSTVYRTLKLLVECGIASIHHFNKDETRYELASKKDHHDHLVCEKCGKIIEFTHNGIEQFQKQVARENDFYVTRHELQIYGLCSKCRKKRKR